MKLSTRITMDGRTDEFVSSPETLRTNVVATLLIARKGREICERFRDVLAAGDMRALDFRDDGVRIEVTEIGAKQVQPDSAEPASAPPSPPKDVPSAPSGAALTGQGLSHATPGGWGGGTIGASDRGFGA